MTTFNNTVFISLLLEIPLTLPLVLFHCYTNEYNSDCFTVIPLFFVSVFFKIPLEFHWYCLKKVSGNFIMIFEITVNWLVCTSLINVIRDQILYWEEGEMILSILRTPELWKYLFV